MATRLCRLATFTPLIRTPCSTGILLCEADGYRRHLLPCQSYRQDPRWFKILDYFLLYAQQTFDLVSTAKAADEILCVANCALSTLIQGVMGE